MAIVGRGRSTSAGMSSRDGGRGLEVSGIRTYSGRRSERTIVRNVDEGVKLESRHFRCFGEYEIKVEERTTSGGKVR
jgi:hypothetical protein